MPNGGILVSNTVARGRGRSNPSPIIDEEAARRAEKNNRIIAAADALGEAVRRIGVEALPSL